MLPIEAIRQALTGWSRILGGHGDWRSYFAFDAKALNLGFILYLVAALLSLMALIIRVGMPAPQILMTLVAGLVLPVVALIFSVSILRRALALSAPVTEFYVPGLFILALLALVAALTILIGIPLWGAILAMKGILLFKLARAVGVPLWPAVGFGVFNFIAGLPYSLYMMNGAFAVPA